MLEISEIIAQAQQKGASDIHIVTGLPVKCRIDGKVQNLTEKSPHVGRLRILRKMPCGRPFHGSNASASLIWRGRFRAEREPESICSASRGAVSAAIRIFGGYHPGDRGAEFAAGRFRIPEYRSGIIFSHR